MKVQELGIEEMARFGATHRIVVLAEDLNGTGTGYGALSAADAAATTGTLTPFAALAAGVMSQFVAGYLKTAFDGTSTTSLTLTGGYNLASGTDKSDGYQAAIELHNDATEIRYFPQEIADPSDTTTTQAAVISLIKTNRKVFTVANTVDLLFTATTANLDDLLTGELHLYFRLNDFTTL